MDRVTFKSLFNVANKVKKDLNYYFNDLDFELVEKFYDLKSFLNQINYLDNYVFRKVSKIINNLLLVYDFSKLQNYKIDLLTLITRDCLVNKEEINGIEKKLSYFTWFNDWINFTKFDLSKFESSKLFIKYIRKELNNSNFVRNYRDTDYYKLMDDIFDFLNSKELDDFPIIKISIIMKQFFYLTPILSLEVLFTIFGFLLKKYHLDINSSFTLLIPFIFNDDIEYSLKVNEIQKMNLLDFSNFIKSNLIKTISFTLEIYNDIINFINEINNTEKIDLIYDDKFKELMSSELIIDFPKLYLFEIYFTRHLYNQKMKEFISIGLIDDIATNSSSTLVNKKMLDLIYLIEYKKAKFK
ncbi:hypothetical protein [Malacoplasma muris]|uniref:hypothetical protein n=1 Tax=Malacoplasma muris TaxID=2119 RepID=UPI00398F7D55